MTAVVLFLCIGFGILLVLAIVQLVVSDRIMQNNNDLVDVVYMLLGYLDDECEDYSRNVARKPLSEPVEKMRFGKKKHTGED